MKYLPGVAPLTKKPEDSGYEITRFTRTALANSRKNDTHRTGYQPVIVYYSTTCLRFVWHSGDAILAKCKMISFYCFEIAVLFLRLFFAWMIPTKVR